MIKASHHPLVYNFFRLFTYLNMKRHFNSVKVVGGVSCENNSVLLLANHISWWDGFWALYLSTNVFRKKYHFMMLENELRKRWLFSYSGGFSVAPGHRNMIESLDYASELLGNKNNLVLMFPQGKLQSMHHNKFVFGKGVERIAQRAPASKTVFLVVLTEYFDHPKPDLYFYLKNYDEKADTLSIQTAYRSFFDECVQLHKEMEL